MGAKNSVSPAGPPSYFFMPLSRLSEVNLFDLRFNACVPFRNRISWNTTSEFMKFYSSFEIADSFSFLAHHAMLKCINGSF